MFGTKRCETDVQEIKETVLWVLWPGKSWVMYPFLILKVLVVPGFPRMRSCKWGNMMYASTLFAGLHYDEEKTNWFSGAILQSWSIGDM